MLTACILIGAVVGLIVGIRAVAGPSAVPAPRRYLYDVPSAGTYAVLGAFLGMLAFIPLGLVL